MLSFYVPEDLKARFDALAESRGKKLADVLRAALQAYVRQAERRTK